MRAARDFAIRLREPGLLDEVDRVTCTLYGSLGATGIGHGTPDAVVAGLQGLAPETVDPDAVRVGVDAAGPTGGLLELDGTHAVPFAQGRHRLRPAHAAARASERDDARGVGDARTGPASTMRTAAGGRRHPRPPAGPRRPRRVSCRAGMRGWCSARRTTRSAAGSSAATARPRAGAPAHAVPARLRRAPRSCSQLCDERGITIAEAARINEEALRTDEEIAAGLDAIWDAMAACVEAGLHADGVLPGMLQVKRRASAIREQLEAAEADGHRELPGEWLGAFALAVNEENAAGGRVVTAPTNGAAGILPAVAMYWWRFLADSGLGAGNAVTPYGELVGSALLGFAGRQQLGPDRARRRGRGARSPRRTAAAASVASCSRRPRWARCSRRTPRSRAPRAAARPRSARRARWPPAGSPR